MWPGCPHLPVMECEFARYSGALANHADRPKAITALEGKGSQVPLRQETNEVPSPVAITACNPHKAVGPMIPGVLVKERRALRLPGMQRRRLVIILPAGVAAMAGRAAALVRLGMPFLSKNRKGGLMSTRPSFAFGYALKVRSDQWVEKADQ